MPKLAVLALLRLMHSGHSGAPLARFGEPGRVISSDMGTDLLRHCYCAGSWPMLRARSE